MRILNQNEANDLALEVFDQAAMTESSKDIGGSSALYLIHRFYKMGYVLAEKEGIGIPLGETKFKEVING